jgi:nucleotide-binding universal stress UspA family protein
MNAQQPVIVVGVDGSQNARAALLWAAREAALRGAVLEVVHTWQFPSVGVAVYGPTAVPVFDPVDVETAAVQVADDAVADALAESPGLDVRPVVTQGDAAETLARQAESTSLLVVGSRGLGGFGRLLLGSTSQHCIHRASCPVVVVPSSWGAEVGAPVRGRPRVHSRRWLKEIDERHPSVVSVGS